VWWRFIRNIFVRLLENAWKYTAFSIITAKLLILGMVLKLKIFLAHNMWKLWFLQRWLFKIILFRGVTSCILVETRRCMEGTCCLQTYSLKMEAADVFETRGLHILEDNIIHIYALNIFTVTMKSVNSDKHSFGGPWKWGRFTEILYHQ
jgi:hypothetical protein